MQQAGLYRLQIIASWLSPTVGSPAAFFEMQKQAVTFIGSFGGAVVVTDESTMVPVMQMQQSESVGDLTEKKSLKILIERRRSLEQLQEKDKASRLEIDKRS